MMITRLICNSVLITENRLDYFGLHNLLPALPRCADGAIMTKNGMLLVSPRRLRSEFSANLNVRVIPRSGFGIILGKISLKYKTGILAHFENLFRQTLCRWCIIFAQ